MRRGELARGELRLVGEVVDGEHARRPSERAVRFDRVEVDGDERRRPVVDVHHVGRPAEVLAELDRAATQEGEADQVVVRPRAGRVVEVAAAEEGEVVEEVDRHVALRDCRLRHARPRFAPAERDAERRGAALLHLVERDDVVARHDDARVAAERAERDGEGADDVAEAACLDEGCAFRGDEEDGRVLGHSRRGVTLSRETRAGRAGTMEVRS